MYTLAKEVRTIYWDKKKRKLRIEALLAACELHILDKRWNPIIEVEAENVFALEEVKKIEKNMLELTHQEKKIISEFEIRATNALSNGLMLEVKDFVHFLKTGKL